MKFVSCFTLLLAAPFWALADEPSGIRPRAASIDYPAHAIRNTVDVGAALLSSEQVRATFVSDVYRSYVVVEVGVFPQGKNPLTVDADDFALRVAGTQTIVRPARAKVVAGVLQKTAPTSRDVTLYPTVGIGYESGSRRYDPVSGTSRGGGVYTSAGVGVGVENTRPGATDQDRKTVELELTEKGLPEGSFSKPVAGYLYFPSPSKKKPVRFELEYVTRDGRIALPLPSK